MYTIKAEEFTYVGRMIQNRRKELGLTQEELAEKLEVSATHMGRVEKGSRPGLDLLTQLARELGLSLDGLLGVVPSENGTLRALVDCVGNRSDAEQKMALNVIAELFESLDSIRCEK